MVLGHCLSNGCCPVFLLSSPLTAFLNSSHTYFLISNSLSELRKVCYSFLYVSLDILGGSDKRKCKVVIQRGLKSTSLK